MKYTENQIERVTELVSKGDSISDAARTMCQENNLEYSDGVRRTMSNILKRGFTHTVTNQYEKVSALSALKPDGTIMTIQEYCDYHGIPSNQARTYKLVTHTGIPFYNIASNVLEPDVKDLDLTSFLKSVKPYKAEQGVVVDSALFDRLVYTDTHVGMNIEDHSLYGGKWDECELQRRLEILINHVVKNRRSPILFIDELGDFMDGYDGYTTRGGHKLPQNMDNQKAFDVGMAFKISMIQSLVPYYDKIVCHNVCEDNHAGSFGYIVNSAFKAVCEAMFDNVEVINQRKFIDHYTYANHVFILTHGKDSKSLKFGFKPNLDKPQENKIDNYIKEHFLLQPGINIEFSKGDSHQYIMDYSTSQSFSYCNYPAFSPSSAWVQVNFQKGISGFCFYNYTDDRKISHDYIWR
jgi:hypothetical protein